MRVLVLDDNEDNCILMKLYLEGLYELSLFDHPEKALLEIDSADPDLLLVDMSLPGMNGVEFLQEVRKNPKYAHIPAIIVTAHASEEDKTFFLQEGFDGYISKPIIDKQILIKEIERVSHRMA